MTSLNSLPKTKKRIHVVGAVLVDGNTVLAAQRGKSMSLPGMWEFPGGKIEQGETPQEALNRELKEELLCTAEIGEHLETTEYEYDFGVVILATYICRLREGVPQLTEHDDIRWVAVPDLPSLNWAPADIPAVDRLVREYCN